MGRCLWPLNIGRHREHANEADHIFLQRQIATGAFNKLFKSWKICAITEWKSWVENEGRTRVALERAIVRMKIGQ